MLADKAESAFGIESVAVEADDARRLLAAMLQGVEAERRDRGGGGMAENAENAAFLTQPVGFEIKRKTIRPDLTRLGANFAGIHGICPAFAALDHKN